MDNFGGSIAQNVNDGIQYVENGQIKHLGSNPSTIEQNSFSGLLTTTKTGISFSATSGVDISRQAGIIYNKYTQSGETTITVASGGIIGGWAELPIEIDGNTITISGAAKDPKSDDASTTATDIDRYIFWKDSIDTYYSITNLG